MICAGGWLTGFQRKGHMLKKIAGLVLLFATVVLAGCVSDEQHVAQMAHVDDATCRAKPNVSYDACRARLIKYRQIASQQNAAERERMGAALQNAGAALQSIDRHPSATTTNCRWFVNTWTCNTF
jgi:hypothetical protein